MFVSLLSGGEIAPVKAPDVDYKLRVERSINFSTMDDKLVFLYECGVDSQHALTAEVVSKSRIILKEVLWFNEISCVDVYDGIDLTGRLQELISISVLDFGAALSDLHEAESLGGERFFVSKHEIDYYKLKGVSGLGEVFAFPVGREKVRYLAFDRCEHKIVVLFDMEW